MRVNAKSFYADLFSLRTGDAARQAAEIRRVAPPPLKRSAPAGDATRRAEPKAALLLPPPAAQVQAADKPAEAKPAAAGRADKAGHPVRELIGDVDLRHLSPRQMAGLSFDLYTAGVVSFEDYAALAFQPELHPDFQRTIGALTGEPAEPDRPRDFVELWQDRADFQRRHNAARPDIVAQHERIVAVLQRIDRPTDVVA